MDRVEKFKFREREMSRDKRKPAKRAPAVAVHEDEEDEQEKKYKCVEGVPADLEQRVATILDRGLFRRYNYGAMLQTLRRIFEDDQAWQDLLVCPSNPREDRDKTIYERRRMWARVTEGKSPATDQELLEMVRKYNLAYVQLQSQRLDCVDDLKTLIQDVPALQRTTNFFWWRRFFGGLLESITNMTNMRDLVMLGLLKYNRKEPAAEWKDTREIVAEDLCVDGQTIPVEDPRVASAFCLETEFKPVEEAWAPVEKRIKEWNHGMAAFVLEPF